MTGDVDAWGIGRGYQDVWGRWREPAPEVAAALRRAMGAPTGSPDERPPDGPAFVVAHTGRADDVRVDEKRWLTLEDGTQLKVRRHLPPDLPLGVHRLESEGGRSRPNVAHVLVRPASAPLPSPWLRGVWRGRGKPSSRQSTPSWRPRFVSIRRD